MANFEVCSSGFTPITIWRKMLPPCSKLPLSYLQPPTVVRRISLHERRGCPGASTPLPAGDDWSFVRSDFSSCPRYYPPRQSVHQTLFPLLVLIITHELHRVLVSYHPGIKIRLLRRWSCKRSSRTKIVLRRRLSWRDFLPQPVYLWPHIFREFLRRGRPSRFKIYYNTAVLRIIRSAVNRPTVDAIVNRPLQGYPCGGTKSCTASRESSGNRS